MLNSSPFLLIGLIVMTIPALSGQVTEVTLQDPHVRTMGRTLTTGTSQTLEYPGIEIVLRFKGSSLRLEGEGLSGENWFNLELNGQVQDPVETGVGSFSLSLAEGLNQDEVHTVRLLRRNEHWQGSVRLDRFLIEGGESLAPPPFSSRRMMAIGDSITCGQGVDFIPPDAKEGHHTANAGGSYAWLLARSLGTQIHLVSYGGKGLIRDWEGNYDDLRAPEFFERTSPYDPDALWDHHSYQPELILIALGTNDFSSGLMDPDTYAAAYVRFIERIHAVHPKAKFLLMSSPMLERTASEGEPAKETVLRQALRKVETHYRNHDSITLRIHEVGHYPGTEWDAHPIAPQHQAIAEELTPVIREMLEI